MRVYIVISYVYSVCMCVIMSVYVIVRVHVCGAFPEHGLLKQSMCLGGLVIVCLDTCMCVSVTAI